MTYSVDKRFHDLYVDQIAFGHVPVAALAVINTVSTNNPF